MSRRSLDIIADSLLANNTLKQTIPGDLFSKFYRELGNKIVSHRIYITKAKIKTDLGKAIYVVYTSDNSKDEILYKGEEKDEKKTIGEKELEELTNIVYNAIVNNIALINNIKVNLVQSSGSTITALMQGDSAKIATALNSLTNINVSTYLYDKVDSKNLTTIESNIRTLIGNLVKVNSLTSSIPIDTKNINLAEVQTKVQSMINTPEKIKSLFGELQRLGLLNTDGSNLSEHIRSLSKLSLQFNRYIVKQGLAEISLELQVNTGDPTNIGTSIEKALGSFSTPAICTLIQKQLEQLATDNANNIVKSFIDWGNRNSLLDLPGSKTPNDLLLDHFQALLLGEKTRIAELKTQTQKKKSPKKVSAKGKTIESKPNKSTKEEPFKAVRNRIGQFASGINLINYINLLLSETIRKNMGTPKLNWRTGRFARSANVLEHKFSSDGYLNLYYTYMTYPYQTFEPGFAQGDRHRDPRVVIGQSIREIATTMVLNKLRIIRRVL